MVDVKNIRIVDPTTNISVTTKSLVADTATAIYFSIDNEFGRLLKKSPEIALPKFNHPVKHSGRLPFARPRRSIEKKYVRNEVAPIYIHLKYKLFFFT